MIRRTFALSALLVAAVAGAQTVTDTPPAPAPLDSPVVEEPKLSGQVENGIYRAPSGAYAVPVPKLHGDAATIMDTDTIVVFKDKVSVLLTIAAFPMPAFARWQYQINTPRDYLVAFFRDNILRDYTNEFPESRVENVKFLPEYHGGTLLAYTVMPGGSAFDLDPASAALPLHAPGVAKRGHLVFVKNDVVFVLAIELAERVTKQSEYHLSTADEDRILLERLLLVVTAMQIPAAARTSPAP